MRKLYAIRKDHIKAVFHGSMYSDYDRIRKGEKVYSFVDSHYIWLEFWSSGEKK